jgi:O-antigen/teichoic acid export membrane protein
MSLVVIGLVTTPLILRLTSASLYGFWITALSILGFLALTDFGLSISLLRQVAARSEGGNGSDISPLVSTAFFIFCAAGALFLAIGLGIANQIPGWFRVPESESSIVVRAYQVAVLTGALSLPLSTFGAVVGGLQRLGIQNVIRDASALLALILSIVLVLSGMSILGLAVANLCSVVIASLCNFYFAKRFCSGLRIRLSLVNRRDVHQLAAFGGYFQLGRVANTVATNADSLVISSTLGAAQVSPYVFTSKLAVLVSISIASKAPIALFPAMAQMFARREIVKLQRIFIRLTWFATRFAIIAAAFIAITNREFVSLWVGPQYYAGAAVSSVFVYWVLQDTIYRGTAAVAHASGDLHNWAMASLLEAGLNIAISIALVAPLGLLGVALGTSIGKTLTTGLYVPYWICGRISLPRRLYLWKGVVSPMIWSVPGVLLTWILAKAVPNTLGWVWVLCVGIVALTANVVTFEGVQLFRSPRGLWRDRLWSLVTLPPD